MPSRMSVERTVELNNGVRMPSVGFGTWRLEGEVCRRAVGAALGAGYRLFDTASYYHNEVEVGEAVRESGVDRGEVFITTKLWNHEHGRDEAKEAISSSLRRLGMEHVDLYLIHWPTGGRNIETWKAMVGMVEEGSARAIGVSNFSMADIEPLVNETGVVPAVDQVEFSPQTFDPELLEASRPAGVVLQGYSPLKYTNLQEPAILSIAQAHRRTAAQIVIRWVMQKGVVPLVKSSHEDRIKENLNVFGFRLSSKDVETLDSLR